MTIAEYVIACRRKTGLGREAFGRLLSGEPSFKAVKNFEIGKTEPTIPVLLEMESISGLSLDDVDPRLKSGHKYVMTDWLQTAIDEQYHNRRQAAMRCQMSPLYMAKLLDEPQSCKMLPKHSIAIADYVEGRNREQQEQAAQAYLERERVRMKKYPRAKKPTTKCVNYSKQHSKNYEFVGEEYVARSVLSRALGCSTLRGLDKFRFKKRDDGKFEAHTDEWLDFLIELYDDGSARLMAWTRANGQLFMDRVIAGNVG